MEVRRGDVLLADLNPAHGTEPGKKRPVVVVQSDLLNDVGHPSTLVCPVTSKVDREVQYLRVALRSGDSGLSKPSAILVDQVRAIDNRRLVKFLGRVPGHTMDLLADRLGRLLDIG
jgi:mRNA interferase MazF